MVQDEEGSPHHDQQPSKRRKGSLDMNRLMARYAHQRSTPTCKKLLLCQPCFSRGCCAPRAGPAPEEDTEDDGTDEDMVGSKSDDDEHKAHVAASAAHPSSAGRLPATSVPDLGRHQQPHMQRGSAHPARDSHGWKSNTGREGDAGIPMKEDPHALHSKRKQKPLSQLQRIAAKVKEQKVLLPAGHL